MFSYRGRKSSRGDHGIGRRDNEAPKGRLRALQPSDTPPEPEKQPIDPLAAAIRHNSHTFLFSRLSEELLLEIMDWLDPVSIFCLRRTCSAFLRLFSSHAFRGLHDKEGFFEPGPWAAQELLKGDDWFAMAQLLNRDAYCPPCQVGHLSCASLLRNYMHCGGCGLDHSATLFSAAQRRADRAVRVCIGLEGHIRLCEHATVTAHRHPVLSPGFTCTHPSHVPEHHANLNLKGMSVFPTLEVGVGDPGTMMLSHTAHLDLSGHGDEVITAEAFRAHILELRKGPAGYIVPEYGPGILAELRAFDPTRCGCLLYPGLPRRQDACAEHTVTRTLFSRVSQGTNTVTMSFASCEHGDRCVTMTHTRTIHFRTGMRRRELGATLPERVRGEQCSARWQLRRALDASAGAVSYNWYSALEPSSYGLESDHDARGLTWCADRRCANYHGYLRERAIRGQRINAECRDGCREVTRVYRLAGRRSEFGVGVKRNGMFGLRRGALWVDGKWRVGKWADRAEVVEDPKRCVIL